MTPSQPLSPSSPPFIFPKSSPTFTSTSDSTSAGTLSSTYVESGSPSTCHSDKPKPIGSEKKEGKIFPSSINNNNPNTTTTTTTAKSFGAGWKSSSPFSMLSSINDNNNGKPLLHVPNQNNPFNTRSRSPSLPVLPSQALKMNHFPGNDINSHILYPINTKNLPNDYEVYTPSSPHSVGLPFSTFPISPIDEHLHLNSIRHHPSLSSIDVELEDHHPFYPIGGHGYSPISPINHQQSVPNLPFLQQGLIRRPSGASDRFYDDDTPTQDHVEDYSRRGLRRMPAFNFGQIGPKNKLLNSKSMPIIPMLGEGRNVFIHRVNSDLTEDSLRIYASEFGDVVSVKIPPRTTRPHAFVMFKKPEQAQSFIMHLKMKNIECEFGKEDYQVQNKALEDPNSANLYIAGLPTTLTYDDITELLSPGKICSWKPLVDEAGNRRGPIMARLQTRVQANDVIRKINGKYYQGMSERIQARIADSDEQKHFKRYQSTGRDRSLESIHHEDLPEEEMDDVELLQTRDYLASQLEALNCKLARTHIKPRNIVFPDNQQHNEPGIIGPAPLPIGQGAFEFGHRHSSSNLSAENLGSWPDWTGTWAQNASSVPATLAYNNNNGGQTRQQTLSFTDPPRNDYNGGPFNALHHVRSSPELGGRMDSASRLLWTADGA